MTESTPVIPMKEMLIETWPHHTLVPPPSALRLELCQSLAVRVHGTELDIPPEDFQLSHAVLDAYTLDGIALFHHREHAHEFAQRFDHLRVVARLIP